MMSLFKRILLAIVSGALVWPLSYLVEGTGTWGVNTVVGAPFAALVLAPLVSRERHRAAAIVALVVGSVLIYALAVELATSGYGPLQLGKASQASITLSGLVGALLVCALTTFAAPLNASARRWMAIVAAGLAGGFFFGFVADSNQEAVAMTGYVVWQALVCIALNIDAVASRLAQPTA